ncbi:hypothetical protein ACJX0J_009358, partial [Zea mays]
AGDLSDSAQGKTANGEGFCRGESHDYGDEILSATLVKVQDGVEKGAEGKKTASVTGRNEGGGGQKKRHMMALDLRYLGGQELSEEDISNLLYSNFKLQQENEDRENELVKGLKDKVKAEKSMNLTKYEITSLPFDFCFSLFQTAKTLYIKIIVTF